MASKSVPLLWHFPISHFNEKVRWALDYKQIPHRRRALGVTYLPRAWLATRRAKLPILFLDGKAISDSTTILESLERFKPDPPLYPRGADRGRAIDLENWFDEELGDAVRSAIIGPGFEKHPQETIRTLSVGMSDANLRLMRLALPAFAWFYNQRHAINPATVAKSRDQVVRGMDRVRAEVQPSGYLVGDRFTVADLTAAALLAPLVGPSELQYPPPEPLAESFARSREEFGRHPAAEWVKGIYARHRGRSAEVTAA